MSERCSPRSLLPFQCAVFFTVCRRVWAQCCNAFSLTGSHVWEVTSASGRLLPPQQLCSHTWTSVDVFSTEETWLFFFCVSSWAGCWLDATALFGSASQVSFWPCMILTDKAKNTKKNAVLMLKICIIGHKCRLPVHFIWPYAEI